MKRPVSSLTLVAWDLSCLTFKHLNFDCQVRTQANIWARGKTYSDQPNIFQMIRQQRFQSKNNEV